MTIPEHIIKDLAESEFAKQNNLQGEKACRVYVTGFVLGFQKSLELMREVVANSKEEKHG